MSGLDFYNDNDPAACAWIEQLIAAGLIPPGRVDNRSIADVRATDLAGLRRVHFFAGIGGWAEALRLADFPDWLPVWTGSPPCQPFSAAGKRAGRDDARHLGPAFVDLVRAGRPPVLFGEQVASSDAIGRAAKPRQQGAGAEPAWAWWDDLSLRLEAAGYAAWAAVVPAAGVGAPHIRERLFFGAVRLADTYCDRQPGSGEMGRSCDSTESENRQVDRTINDGRRGRLADTDGGYPGAERKQRSREHGQQQKDSCACGLADAASLGRLGRRAGEAGAEPGSLERPDGLCHAGRLADYQCFRHEKLQRHGYFNLVRGRDEERSRVGLESRSPNCRSVSTDGFWSTVDWLLCRDDKWRPVESGTQPMAHGLPARMGRLRGYGNAINPYAAAAFIEAFLESL